MLLLTFCRKNKRRKNRHWPKVQKRLKQRTEAEKMDPPSSRSLQRIFQKWEMKEKLEMSQNRAFISLALPCTPSRAAGQTQKKKKNSFLLSQSSETCPKNISIATAANQSSQVKSGIDPWIVFAHKSEGNKIWNHVFYPTPLIALKMLDSICPRFEC